MTEAVDFKYFAVANDDNGKPFVWGYHHDLEKAKQSLLPDTWIIDAQGNKLAEHKESKCPIQE